MSELGKIKTKVVFELESLRANKKVMYHTGLLIMSQIIVFILGFFTKGIQTRALTPDGYGLYAFFTTITGFSVLFFSVGLFPTMEVLLASNHDKQKEKEFFGASFILTFFAGIIFSIFLFAISFFIDNLFQVNFGKLLRLLAPLCFIFPFRLLIPALATGSNKIENSAWFDILFQLLFSAVLSVMFFYSNLDVKETLLLNLFSCIIAVIYIIFRFRPSFSHFSERYKEIKLKNKEYGIHYYIGSIFSETTYKLDEIFITYFINTTQLGFYSLANIICSPMVLFSGALSSALFKRFANYKKIPAKIFALNIVWIIISAIILFFFSKMIIEILFGKEFNTVSTYVMPLIVAYILKTLYQPFSFLAAKGKGKEMRNVAIIEGIVSIVTNIIFVPLFGVMGAIYASILARATDLVGLFYYYLKYLQETRNQDFGSADNYEKK
ncbi:MAG: oligosaccharide flippase family protein [Bacteroidota bacterium]